MRDCLFLVADKNMEAMLRGFLEREACHQSLGRGPFDFDYRQDLVVAHGQNDPGLYTRARELLMPFAKSHRHAVVMIDAAWDGSPGAVDIRGRLRDHLEAAGWAAGDGHAVVIDPELENWIWQDSPHVASALSQESIEVMRDRLAVDRLWPRDQAKPPQPKETLEWILRQARIPRSSSIYRKITGQVSLRRCADSAFIDLRDALRRWFPEENL